MALFGVAFLCHLIYNYRVIRTGDQGRTEMANASAETGLTIKREMAGIYTVLNAGKSVGMIQGDEHYTGKPRKWWTADVQGIPFNMFKTLTEAKEYVGIRN